MYYPVWTDTFSNLADILPKRSCEGFVSLAILKKIYAHKTLENEVKCEAKTWLLRQKYIKIKCSKVCNNISFVNFTILSFIEMVHIHLKLLTNSIINENNMINRYIKFKGFKSNQRY